VATSKGLEANRNFGYWLSCGRRIPGRLREIMIILEKATKPRGGVDI
jgi:hypothetical protein